METRRKFLAKLALTPFALTLANNKIFAKISQSKFSSVINSPIVVTTWDKNIKATETAFEILKNNGRALDAVEKGVNVTEADPKNNTVGYGGLPDRDGYVTLDACIMDENGNCGSVAFLQNIMHPISVARLVMEKTPHIMLVGKGALEFALQNGFKEQNLLTEEAKKAWEEWLQKSKYSPKKIDKENHDTIGMIALDKAGNLSGACSTSGLSFKYHGRVGDSPIIGAGLYVDNDIGAAVATGKGEAVIKVSGTFLVVEYMRQGLSPKEACKKAIERVIKKNSDYKEFQVGFIALNKNGEYGAYSIDDKFTYCVYDNSGMQVLKSEYYLK